MFNDRQIGRWKACLRSLFFVPVLLIGIYSKAQNGNYFITNLTPPDEQIDPRSIGAAQNDLGVIYFTNKNGILEFDGNNWRLIPTTGSVYTLTTFQNQIFAGGSFGFGELIPATGKGNEFHILSGKPNIFSAITIQDKIFFCSDSEIFSYSIDSKELSSTSIPASAGNFFQGLYQIGGKPYATSVNNGLQKIEGNQLTSPEFKFPDNQSLVFSISNDKETLLGTDIGMLFRHQGEAAEPINLVDSVYISLHGLVNASWVGEELVALGTLKGGVIFINPFTGSTTEIVDYDMGLPDNDVLSIFTDRNKGVWVSHEYGFSRIAPYLPYRSFNHYPGLSGNLLCVKEIDTTLYVGTSLGLYYLKTEDQYEEIEVIQRSTRTIKSNSSKTTVTQVAPEPEKTRRKLFGFLRKNKEKGDEPKAEDGKTNAVKEKPKTETVITRATKKILKSRQYVYKKIEGITGKVTQMVEFKGRTIVGGLGGVFTLNGTTLTPIFRDPVRYVFHSAILDQLFISTYDDKTISMVPLTNGWEQTHYLDTLHDYISYVFEDNQANIWFCGRTKIYKMELVDKVVTALEALPIQNPLFDETVGIALGHDVYVAASGAFKRYDRNEGFLNYDSFPGPKKYFASAGSFWFNDGHHWRTLDRQLQELKLEWLGLFPNMRYLSPSHDGKGLWMVTAKNELYKFSNPTDERAGTLYPLYLRDVRGEKVKLLKDRNLRMDQSENTVYFEFTQPSYLGFRATEFRYLVHGLTKEWSEWSNVNNLISFSYLPPGEYQLEVQSRDILGNESEVELVTFEVLPYYWKRWWFYAIEFAFVCMLIYFSIQLGGKDDRYKMVSQILTLLTVILLIQFIETGIDSLVEFKSSPVVEFLIQLGITLVVFPVESQLRHFMHFVSARKYNPKS